MYSLLPKIISYNFFKKFGFPKLLPMILTIGVNDWCNSKCKTCNIWKNNPRKKIKEELKLEEYKKIFSNYGKSYWITITGGEPFLKKNLVQIIQIIYKKTKPEFITIATNGILTKRIVSWTKEILNSCKNLKLIVNISLDGIGKQHDEIRGARNSFNLVVKTFRKLKSIKNPRLTVGINTVISKFNIKNFPEIYDYIMQNLKPDSFVAEVAENRAKLYNMKLKITPRTNEYQKALIFLIKQQKKQNKNNVLKIIEKLRMEFYKYLISNGLMKVFEGIASAYVMSNGDVWLSYSKPFIAGNLREVNYDFKKNWFSDKAKKLREIMNKNYRTMLANAFYCNMICNPFKILKILIRYYVSKKLPFLE